VDVHNDVGECTVRVLDLAKGISRTTGNESFRRSIVGPRNENHLGGGTSCSKCRILFKIPNKK
jgi:hypothetical protein